MVAQWLTVGWRYHRIKKRIVADPASKAYVDDATRPVSIDEMENDELVSFFADKIPDTYGAQKGSRCGFVTRPRLDGWTWTRSGAPDDLRLASA